VPSHPAFGALCALGAALAWSITSLLARTLMPHYGSVTINAVRSGIAGTFLVAWVVIADGPAALVTMSGTTFAVLIVSIVMAIGLGDTVFFESTRAIGLGRAMTIATTYPVGAAVLAAVLYGERITTPIAAGTLLTLGGVALIVGVRAEARPERLWFGVWTAVVASVAWAVSTAMMKTPLTEIDPLTAQAIRLPLASAFCG
jgi:drug/metabolite transporter (DMT)-like permease